MGRWNLEFAATPVDSGEFLNQSLGCFWLVRKNDNLGRGRQMKLHWDRDAVFTCG